jgi:hypothetical protein
MVEAVNVLGILKNANDVESAFGTSSGLNWRQRRKLGLTRVGIFNVVKELRASSNWNDSVSPKDLAQEVALALTEHPDYAEAYCGLDAGFD